MTKRHPFADRQQPLGRGSSRCRGVDAESLGRAPHQQRVPDRLRRRDQQQQPRLRRQRLEPPQEALLDPSRQGVLAYQPEPAGQLRRREPSWQL
jgi:hypothetical protein